MPRNLVRAWDYSFIDFSSKGVDGLFNPQQVDDILSIMQEIKQTATIKKRLNVASLDWSQCDAVESVPGNLACRQLGHARQLHGGGHTGRFIGTYQLEDDELRAP